VATAHLNHFYIRGASVQHSSFDSLDPLDSHRGATHNLISLFATLFATLVVALSGRADAQAAQPSQAARATTIGVGTGAALMPGSSDLSTAHFRDTTISYHFIEDRLPNGDSVNKVSGVGHEQVRHVMYKGRPALLFVKSVDLNGTTYVDSSAVLADGLAPLWERSTFGSRRKTYDYEGARVHRTITQPDSATKISDHDFGAPMFHFEGLDAVIRSIPLRPDYRTIVRLYSEGDDAIETDTISVDGRDRSGVWNVRFADPVIIAHYGIDGNTRRIVRYDIARHADRAHFMYVFDQ
jgi:hypothetical protein